MMQDATPVVDSVAGKISVQFPSGAWLLIDLDSTVEVLGDGQRPTDREIQALITWLRAVDDQQHAEAVERWAA